MTFRRSIVFLATLLMLYSCSNLSPDYRDSVCELSFSPHTSEAAIVSLIEDARQSIYVALYGFENKAVEEALVEAYTKRGIDIKMVTEYDSESSDSWQRMIHEGIPVVLGNTDGIMHNKYFIFDMKYVVTGSTNLTEGMLSHFNNLIVIKSEALAADYKMDFDVLYNGYFRSDKDDGFDMVHGNGIDIDWPEQWHTIGNYEIKAFFTPYKKTFPSYQEAAGVDYTYYCYDDRDPNDGVEDGITSDTYKHALNVVIPLLQNAKKSIYLLVFAFTDRVIAHEMMKAYSERGVDVKIWMDHQMYSSQFRYSGGTYLALRYRLGIHRAKKCRRTTADENITEGMSAEDIESTRNGLLHHKVIMIDDNILILGSLNFSASAVESNDENFLIIKNAGPLIEAFKQEAVRIGSESEPIPDRPLDFESSLYGTIY